MYLLTSNVCVCVSKLAISSSVREWLIDDKLSVHLGKIESIVKNKYVESLFNGAEIVSQTYSVSYLGIILEQSLSCESIAAKML